MTTEARPDHRGRNEGTFPPSWGQPPQDRRELRAWIRRNIEQGEERRARGERVEWLAAFHD